MEGPPPPSLLSLDLACLSVIGGLRETTEDEEGREQRKAS